MGMFTEPLDENKILRSKVYLLERKLLIAKRALVDIKKWDNELEDEYGDPGERASDALEKIMILDGF